MLLRCNSHSNPAGWWRSDSAQRETACARLIALGQEPLHDVPVTRHTLPNGIPTTVGDMDVALRLHHQNGVPGMKMHMAHGTVATCGTMLWDALPCSKQASTGQVKPGSLPHSCIYSVARSEITLYHRSFSEIEHVQGCLGLAPTCVSAGQSLRLRRHLHTLKHPFESPSKAP